MTRRTPAPLCRACDRVAVAKGLCLRCYKRVRRGRPLPSEEPARGSPSGLGVYGVLDDDGDTVLCHECGRRVRALGPHLQRSHPDMDARAYRLAHGLPMTLPLVSAAVSAAQSVRSRARVGSPGWRRLEAARDPEAAAAARDAEVMVRAAVMRATDRGRPPRRPVVKTCPVCGATWCPLRGGDRRRVCSTRCQHQWRRQRSSG